ncbi:hypothetical protein LZ30DRAFT_727110 [Colletotrichum cereale]|nr:hypothetical protein LZ30DRAFT_727110 [Colletotrichum cereale]
MLVCGCVLNKERMASAFCCLNQTRTRTLGLRMTYWRACGAGRQSDLAGDLRGTLSNGSEGPRRAAFIRETEVSNC